MSYKDWRVRIDDILEAIGRCKSYVEGLDSAAFQADTRSQDAVARNLEIIGEAASKMPDPIREAFPLVPWQQMAEMRHILIHEYHSVDAEILLRTVLNDLPPLVVMLQTALENSEGPDGELPVLHLSKARKQNRPLLRKPS